MAVAPTDLALSAAAPSGRSLRAYIRRHPTIVAGGLLLLLMAAMAVFAPYLGTADPEALSPIDRLKWPSAAHWFGTDMLGRDVYSRTIYGARVSLAVGLSVALLSTGCGLLIGLVTGFSRWADAIVMRIMDGLMSIPSILIAIALMALTRASLQNVVFAITVGEVPRVTRLVRGVVLTLRELPFVEAAVAGGTRPGRILWRHILPNTLPPLIVQATTSFPVAILAEAGLAYLGLGTQPPQPSWGLMLKEAQSFLAQNPWFAVFPGSAIALTVLGLNLFGDGLRDVLDPKTT